MSIAEAQYRLKVGFVWDRKEKNQKKTFSITPTFL